MNGELRSKRERLLETLAGTKACVIAYSGGVDSAYLLAEAVKILGERCIAATIISPVQTEAEIEEARNLARSLGANHREVHMDELQIPEFVANPPDRCYYCKKERGGALLEMAAGLGHGVVFDGTNADDGGDYRPGHRALKEGGIKSPLAAAGLTKADVRELSRELNLPTWSRPSMACLATRFPYGVRITGEGLTKVARAEAGLKALDFKVVRVRVHGDAARIELNPADIAAAAGPLREKVVQAVKGAGFAYAALDLEGYRTGSMNEILSEDEKAK